MDFSEIIGHEKVIEGLRKAIRNHSISHSYLFEGEEGIGKRRVAYALAKTLLCKEEGDSPCNSCTSCRKFDGGNHPDFFLIEPEKDIIRVHQIEGLIKEITTSPLESKRKIFIIDDSHKFNKESANKFLKTLEEPPSYVNIILISSNPSSILPTILSRVQTIKFQPVEYERVVGLLTRDYGKSLEEAKFIAEFTKGAIGKARSLAEDDSFFQRRNEIINIIQGLLQGDKTKAFSSLGFFNQHKEIIDELLDIFLLWFRDLLIYKEIGENHLIINKDKLEYLSAQSNVNSNRINDIIVRIQETKDNIKRNVNYQLAIETMLLYIGGI